MQRQGTLNPKSAVWAKAVLRRGANAQSRTALPAALPPDDEAAAAAAHGGELVGQNQETQRNHPEAKDRQEAQAAEEDENDADGDARGARARHVELPAEDGNLARLVFVFHAACRVAGRRSGRHDMDRRGRHCEGKKFAEGSLQMRDGFAIGSATLRRAHIPR